MIKLAIFPSWIQNGLSDRLSAVDPIGEFPLQAPHTQVRWPRQVRDLSTSYFKRVCRINSGWLIGIAAAMSVRQGILVPGDLRRQL